jgi:hypothetical protein
MQEDIRGLLIKLRIGDMDGLLGQWFLGSFELPRYILIVGIPLVMLILCAEAF